VNGDPRAGLDVAADRDQRRLEAMEPRRVVDLAGGEEVSGHGGIGHPAANKDLRHRVPQPQLLLEPERGLHRIPRDLQARCRRRSGVLNLASVGLEQSIDHGGSVGAASDRSG
jgi:hypothetical protein